LSRPSRVHDPVTGLWRDHRFPAFKSALGYRQATPPFTNLAYIASNPSLEWISFMAHLGNNLCGDSSSPMWKQLYQAALLELDPSKLPERIFAARNAMHDRAEDILASSSLAEHRSLNSALHALQMLEHVTAREKKAS